MARLFQAKKGCRVSILNYVAFGVDFTTKFYALKMIRKSVFANSSDKELFSSLQSQWGPNFDLWPSLPLAQIIDVESVGHYLTEKECDFFLKTNIDYTLCARSGRPILSVELYGLGNGFSRHGEYVQQGATTDPYRKMKLDLKLRVAQNEKYPLFVVAFEESTSLDKDICLTIVDGIIGHVLANQESKGPLSTLIADHGDLIELSPSTSEQDYIQDLLRHAEPLAELKWDPIAKLAAKYEHDAFEKGIVKSYRTEYLNHPELPGCDPFTDLSVIDKRIAETKDEVRVGCRIIADTPEMAILETVWLRTFENNAVSPLHIAVNIAELLVFKRALDLAGNYGIR